MCGLKHMETKGIASELEIRHGPEGPTAELPARTRLTTGLSATQGPRREGPSTLLPKKNAEVIQKEGCGRLMNSQKMLSLERSAVGALRLPPPEEPKPHCDLWGKPHLIKWANAWLPIGGSIGGSSWDDCPCTDPNTGYKPDWLKSPPTERTWYENSPSARVHESFVDKEIWSMLLAGHIRQWDLATETIPLIISPIVVSDEREKLRMCVDYRWVNNFIDKGDCSLPSLADILEDVHGDTVLMKLDLKSGYHQLRVKETEQKFLAFSWKGKIFTFLVLPFGLRDAPRKFQAITKYALGQVLKHKPKEIRGKVYLDDFIVSAPEGKSPDLKQIKEELVEKGFVFGQPKCSIGVRVAIVMGMEVDTERMTLRLPEEKSRKLIQLISNMLKTPDTTPISMRSVARVIGKICAAEPGVQQVLLFARLLIMDAVDAMKGLEPESMMEKKQFWTELPWDLPSVLISKEAKASLAALIELFPKMNGRRIRPSYHTDTTIVLEVDASPAGAGGIWYKWGQRHLATEWAEHLPPKVAAGSTLHRETWALCRMLRKNADQYGGKSLVLVGDNEGLSASAVRKGSCTCRLTTQLLVNTFALLLRRGVAVLESRVVYSKDNGWADFLSRVDAGINGLRIAAGEIERLGVEVEMDLMATDTCRVAERFVSPFKHPKAEATDLMLYDPCNFPPWGAAWVFPPPPIARRVLNHIQTWRTHSSGRCIYVILTRVRKENWLSSLWKIGKADYLGTVQVEPQRGFSLPKGWEFECWKVTW